MSIKSINLSNIPLKAGHYDWKHSINKSCDFKFGKYEGTLLITDYKSNGKTSFVKIQYKDIEDWIPTSQLKNGSIGGKLKFFTSDFYYNINDILHCKTDIQILSREIRREDERNRKYYTYKCLTCGEINTTTEAILKENKGCPYCAGRLVKAGINDITITAPWMIPFFENEEEASKYTHGSVKEIFPYCPVCRKKQTKPKKIYYLYESHHSGCSCDTYMSFPEQVVFNLLTQNNIYFIHRATKKELPWAKEYEYDFYLPNQNIIIETHGAQHYNEHGFADVGGKTLEEQQCIDLNKENLAKDNDIYYYVIDCRKSNLDFILTNILTSPLAKELNLTVINKDELHRNVLIYKQKQLQQILKQEPLISKKDLTKRLSVSPLILNRLLAMGGE